MTFIIYIKNPHGSPGAVHTVSAATPKGGLRLALGKVPTMRVGDKLVITIERST